MPFERFARIALVATVTGIPAGASAQSILDTIHGLRSTIRQLGHGASGTTGSVAAPAAAADAGIAVSGQPAPGVAPMVPAVALSQDASDSQLEASPLARGRVQSFDIMGFRLGMSPREVSRLAARRGIHGGAAAAQLTGSFEVEATGEANRQLNRPIVRSSPTYLSTAFGESDRGEHFIFGFTLEPTGPKLGWLEYRAKLNGQTPDQLKAALIAKYGPMTNGYQWCSDSCPALNRPLLPFMTMNIFGSELTLGLDAGTRYRDNARRVLEARAQAIAAQRGDGVRF